MECPSCDGRGCDECNNGHFALKVCPNKYSGELISAIDLFDCYENGVLPIAGGALDQSAWFIHAAKTFKTEEALAKTITNG